MKKLALLAFIIILVCTFVGCQDTGEFLEESTVGQTSEVWEESTDDQTSESSTTADQLDVTVYTEIYAVSEGHGGVFAIDLSQAQSKEPFTNENAQQNLQIELLGDIYDVKYKESIYFGDDNIPVDSYSIVNGEDHEYILVNSETGDIVKYNYLPHTAELKTEQDYLAFIEQVLGEGATNGYEYHCTTHYYETSDRGFRSTVEDGFIVCGENQTLGGYTFYYTKRVDGIILPDHITADFDKNEFMIEKVELGYDASHYQPIVSNIDAISKHIEEYILQNLNEGIICTGIEIQSHRAVYHSGKLQVSSYVTVKIVRENDPKNSEFEIVVRTLTECETQNSDE